MRLRLSSKFGAGSRQRIRQIVVSLPEFINKDFQITAHPQLTDYRGKLLSGFPTRGTEIYAAAFIRQRRIVLETTLLRQPEMLRLILTHEVFHFVWVRLGNKARRKFAVLLRREIRMGARGELGESASVRKSTLRPNDLLSRSTIRWRDYVCESFCDTAAWFYSETQRADHVTLARRWKNLRQRWFLENFPDA